MEIYSIHQLLSEDAVKEACGEHPLCVISVLPHILDCQSACRNKYIDMLKTLGEKYKQKMWGYVITLFFDTFLTLKNTFFPKNVCDNCTNL
jgi:hypothetical protein